MTTPPSTAREWRGFAIAAYVIAGLLALDTATNAVAGMMPASIRNPVWRQGVGALLAHSAQVWVFIAVIVLVVAFIADHRRMLRVLGLLAGLGGLVYLLLAIPFVHDAFELYGFLPFDERPRFAVVSAKGLWQSVLGSLCLIGIWWVARRSLAIPLEPVALAPPSGNPPAPRQPVTGS